FTQDHDFRKLRPLAPPWCDIAIHHPVSVPSVPIDPGPSRLVARDNRRASKEELTTQSTMIVRFQSPTEAKPLVGKSYVTPYHVMTCRHHSLPARPDHLDRP